MKIKNITLEVIKIPLKTPFITALRRVENVEFVRAKVLSDSGVTSFGEAPATKAITGEDLQSISETIQEHKNLFYGVHPTDAIEILHKLSIGSSAKACLDMAFYALENDDIRLSTTLKKIHPKTAITISFNHKDKMLQDAKEAVENGQNILKLKFASDIFASIQITKAIQKQLPKAMILADANQSWSIEDSKIYLDALRGTKIELVEQPLKADNINGMRELKNYSNIPIASDESCFNLDDVKKVVESKSADIINIKLMKCGGVTKAIEILEYCKDKKVPVMFGSMLEGPISIAYACFLADKYKDVVKYVDLDSPLLYKTFK